MIFRLWFCKLFQLGAPLHYILPSVPAENLFYHWIYWFTEPITLVPGCFSILENTLFLCNVILAIYHCHKSVCESFIVPERCKIRFWWITGKSNTKQRSIPLVLESLLQQHKLSDRDRDSERESHEIMPQLHKMLKTVTNTRYEQSLVMQMQDSKGHWRCLVTIKEAHTSISCWLRLPGTTSGRDLQRMSQSSPFNRGTKDFFFN